MTLTQITPPVAAPAPLREFDTHLRLSEGFADIGADDASLELYLRAAAAAIERKLDSALISQQWLWRTSRWPGARCGASDCTIALPLSPVISVESLSLLDHAGASVAVDPSSWRLDPAADPARIAPTASALPSIPTGGWAEIAFTAGYGWSCPSLVPVSFEQCLL